MPESPTEPDIFTVGGTVQAGSGLYLSRNADRELRDLCRSGAFAYVLTPRQLGKSSLMVRTASRLAQEGIRSVMIDLTQIGVQVTAETWYLGLLAAIEDQLGLGSDVIKWWQGQAHLGVTQRLTLFFQEVLLTEVTEPVVIFVDEIDTTLSLAFTDDFFAAIRFFSNARAYVPEFHRLSFVLIGVATPGDLIRDPQRTPFNIGQRVDLTDFAFEEALPLAEGLGLKGGDAQQALRRVLWWTGGHPYLTQRLCRALALQHRSTWSDDDVDQLVATTFLGHVSEQDNNLQFVRDMLTKRAPDLTAVLTTYQKVRIAQPPVVDEEQSLVMAHLKLSGVVRRDQRTLHVRNQIYNDVFDDRWIKEHLPVSWLKRARQAGIFLAASLVVAAVPLALYAWQSAASAERDRDSAERDRQSAVIGRDIAERDRQSAFEEWAKVTGARAQAENALKEAERRRYEAEANLRITQEQRQRAERFHIVSRLAADSEAVQPVSPKTLLLAVEAMKRSQSPSFEVDRALRRGLMAWPRPLSQPRRFAGVSHADRVLSLAFSRTGQYLATAASDSSIRVWEVNNTERVVATMDHSAAVTAMSFSPSGRYLATASSTTARLWELASGVPVNSMSHDVDVTSLAFSPDGRYLATGSGEWARIWEAVAGRPIAEMKHSGAVTFVTFSPDGRVLATAGGDGTARVLEVPTGRQVAQAAHTGGVAALAFSPNGAYVASAGGDGTALVWRTVTGLPIARITHGSAVTSLAFSPDGQYLASASVDGTVRVSGAVSGIQVAQMKHNGAVASVVFSRDGRYLATASGDRTARLWQPATGEQVARLDYASDVTALAFHPQNGKLLATAARYATSAGSYETAQVWEVLGGSEITKVEHGHTIAAVAFSPEGDYLGAAGVDGIIRVWTTAGALVTLPMRHDAVFALSLSSEGKYLATASADRVDVWDVKAGHIVRQQPVVSRVSAIALSSDGRFLAAGSQDNTAQLWDAKTGSRLATMRHEGPVRGLSFSPKGTYLATAADTTARVWNYTGRLLSRLAHDDDVQAVSFSPDGRYIATANKDNTARLWEWAHNQQVGRSMQHNFEVVAVAFGSLPETKDWRYLSTVSLDDTVSLRDSHTGDEIAKMTYEPSARHTAFSPEGRYLATAGSSEGVRVWPWRSELLIPMACSGLANNLTWNEWQAHLRHEPYRKTCPELPTDSSSFLEAARARARAGDLNGSIGIFREARKLDPSLKLSPEAEARRELAQFRIGRGRRRAGEGDVAGAVRIFRGALAMDPTLQLDPETEASRYAALGSISRGESLARQGRIKEALASYEDARKINPEQPIAARSWNTVCWFGSLLSDPAEVLSACERAVELDPKNVNFRDSRGVARALIGNDIPGAIDDFLAYVASTPYPDRKKQRQDWIDALQAGKSPADIFTAQEKKRLLAQSATTMPSRSSSTGLIK